MLLRRAQGGPSGATISAAARAAVGAALLALTALTSCAVGDEESYDALLRAREYHYWDTTQ